MSSPHVPNSNQGQIWFPAKRYGWGWGMPVTWQGWVVMGTWLIVVLSVSPFLAGRNTVGFIIFMVSMTAILIAVCFAKGESPRWRWGNK